jgi:hypothetical protein
MRPSFLFLLTVKITALLINGLSFPQLMLAPDFSPHSVRASKLPLERLPKTKPLRPSGI